jgi:hypothetical protein
MKIVFTRTFDKELNKIGSIDHTEIVREIHKYNRWLSNFVELYEYDDGRVLKWYFLNKKVRICIWFREVHGQFIPFFVARKETKEGNNITKSDQENHEILIEKHVLDIENGNFRILDI